MAEVARHPTLQPAHTLKRGDQSQMGNVLVVTSRTGTAAAAGNNEDSSRNLMISHCVNRPPYYVQIGGLAGAIIPPYTVNSSPLETICPAMPISDMKDGSV